MGIPSWYTHIVTAAAVIQHVRADDIAFMTELRLYSQLVRFHTARIARIYTRKVANYFHLNRHLALRAPSSTTTTARQRRPPAAPTSPSYRAAFARNLQPSKTSTAASNLMSLKVVVPLAPTTWPVCPKLSASTVRLMPTLPLRRQRPISSTKWSPTWPSLRTFPTVRSPASPKQYLVM